MSKISDELRAAGNRLFLRESDGYGTIMSLADRIDAEMVELPRDANDEPILPGDTVYATSGGKCTVTSLQLYGKEDPSWMASICGNGGSYISTGCELTHTCPDSFERIADELDEQAGSLTKDGYTWQEDAIHDFADRIRKLAKKEDK